MTDDKPRAEQTGHAHAAHQAAQAREADKDAEQKGKAAGQEGIDGLSPEELNVAGGDQYAHLDQTRDLAVPLGGQGDGVPSSVLNPAYYPKNTKPEVLHNELERNGSDSPTVDTSKHKDRSRKGEELEAEYVRNRPWLREGDVAPANVSKGGLEAAKG